jgi:alpha-ketoglutarate-dependent taurine dioxygenase
MRSFILPNVKRQGIAVDGRELVEVSQLSESPIPIQIQPRIDGLDFVEWARQNIALLDQLLLEHRALLIRNCGLGSVATFDRFVSVAAQGPRLEYRDRSTPRQELVDRVYTSTQYPSEQTIALHNEGTYWTEWPLKIFFACIQAADQGGETPIADARRVLARISPETQATFAAKGVLYVRNYNDGFGLSWQETFQTDDQQAVEEYCRQHGIEFEWKTRGRLRTRQARGAIARHPKTGESVWFNHAAFFHVSSLEPSIREAVTREFSGQDLPFNTYYGDGSPIEADVIRELRAAYESEKSSFLWQNGDVLLLDNMTVCHGRNPYRGTRQIVVAMAEPCKGYQLQNFSASA